MGNFEPPGRFPSDIFDGLVKSRHIRENGNPENSNYMKILDSGWSLSRTLLRDRNDRK